MIRHIPFSFFMAVVLLASVCCTAQKGSDVITVNEIERIEKVLASDSFRGRKAGTPDIDKAAAFIANEFKKAGLQPLQGNSYLQEFSLIRPKLKELKFKAEGVEADAKNIVVYTSKPELEVDEKSGYAIEYIKAGDDFSARTRQFLQAKKNIIAVVDSSFAKTFSRPFLTPQHFKSL